MHRNYKEQTENTVDSKKKLYRKLRRLKIRNLRRIAAERTLAKISISGHIYIHIIHTHTRDAQIPSDYDLYGSAYLWVLSIELASCHFSAPKIFKWLLDFGKSGDRPQSYIVVDSTTTRSALNTGLSLRQVAFHMDVSMRETRLYLQTKS